MLLKYIDASINILQVLFDNLDLFLNYYVMYQYLKWIGYDTSECVSKIP